MAIKKPTATAGNDKIIGSVNNDTIAGLGGADTINGGLGSDYLDGGAGNDSLNGENGDDILLGSDGNDFLNGGSGNDKLDGGKDNDKLLGDKGNDTLIGGLGVDTMTGGDGDDYYVVDNLKDMINEINKTTAIGGNDTVETVLLDYKLAVNVENLVLVGTGASKGTGNQLSNKITGNDADNVLNGDAGNDTLSGGAGVDTLDGGLGMDVLIGGTDSDVYFMNNTEDKIVEDENGGELDLIKATVSFNLNSSPNVEALELSGAKAIDGIGNLLDNLIQETAGGKINNNLQGAEGNDTLNGEGGDDTLEGGEGNDEIDGGAGKDTVIFNYSKDQYDIKTNVDAEGVPQITVEYVGNVNGATDEGFDTLSNVEFVEFAGETMINAADIISGKFNDPVAPVFASAAVNANSLVLNYVEDNLLNAVTASANAFSVLNGGAVNPVSSISVDVNAKTITLILANTVTNGQEVTVAYTDPTSGDDLNAIQDAVGNDAVSFFAQTVTNNTPDFTPPVFATAAVNGSVLTMTYTEAGLLNSTTAPASAFAVMNGSVANTVTSVAVDVNTKVVTLSLANPVLNGQTVTVAYTDPTTGNDLAAIQDVTGNDAVSLAAQSVTNNTLDNVAPVFASAAVNASVLTMTYTEMGLLNNATALGNAFSVISGGSANPVTAVAVDVNAKTVTLTLATAVLPAQVVTIAYTDPSADNDVNAIQDVAGNDAISFTAQTVTNNTLDTTPPVFVSASVNGNVLTMTYTEDVLNSTTALANAFSVISANVVNPVTAVAVDAGLKTVTLTLTNAAINGQAVTVAYNDPTADNDVNAVQDALGNDAITFTAQNVNNVTVAVVAPPVVVVPPVVVAPVLTTRLPADTRTYFREFTLTEANDLAIVGSADTDKFSCLGGNDVLNTMEGNDYADGGAGDDNITGGQGEDYLLGGDGADVIAGGEGNDSIDGGNGNNTLYGENADDLIVAGNGGDYIDSGAGNDTVDAGEGNNKIYGQSGDDSLTSSNGNDSIDGGAGDDSIDAGDGNNTVVGGSGGDMISCGDGNDMITDTSSGSTSKMISADDTIWSGGGNDTIKSSTGNDDIDGEYGNDTITDGSGDDTIHGGDDNDSIVDGSGVNLLYGDEGNDTITGTGKIYGGGGNDTLVGSYIVGGLGVDKIATGGAGTIRYEAITDSGIGTGNRDIISDFDTGSASDVMDLSSLSTSPLNYLGESPFDGTNAVRYTADVLSGKTIVSVDVTGDKIADMEIELTGMKYLAADDFLLVKVG